LETTKSLLQFFSRTHCIFTHRQVYCPHITAAASLLDQPTASSLNRSLESPPHPAHHLLASPAAGAASFPGSAHCLLVDQPPGAVSPSAQPLPPCRLITRYLAASHHSWRSHATAAQCHCRPVPRPPGAVTRCHCLTGLVGLH
jgi:hypothetical protein